MEQAQSNYDYMKTRWQEQKDYHKKKADEYKKLHRYLQLIIGLGAVLVPVLLTAPGVFKEIVAVFLSLAVALATAIENIYKAGDNWRTFRQTEEALEAEKALFLANAGVYKNASNDNVKFAERCERILNEQNRRFFAQDDEGQSRDKESTAQMNAARN